jgi:hypothetical protein
MPVLEEVGPDQMLFQKELGAPLFCKEATDILIRNFPEKLISRGETVTCPPRSPNKIHLHFYALFVRNA